MKNTNAHPLRLTRLNLSRPLTQQQLADFTGVSLSTIVRAERGESIRLDCIQRICEYLDRPAQELGLAHWQNEGNQHGNDSYSDTFYEAEEERELEQIREGDDRMNRREAIKQLGNIGLTLAAAPLISVTSSPERYTSPARIPNIDEETWQQFSKLIETCWHLSKGSVLDIVEPTLWAYLPKLAAIAVSPSKQQQPAASITSQGYLLAAILAGHRDDLNARQHYSEQALSHGNVAKDRNLQVAALRQLALTFDYKDRPRKALQTYEQSVPFLEEVSPLLCSRMYAGLADSYAQFEREQDALRCMSLAYEGFPEKPEDDPTFLYADCDYFTLVLWDGLTHLDLNQAKEADKAFARVDGLHPKMKVPERVRIEFLNYQAETFVSLRDMDRSCTYLEEAVRASLALGSERRYTQANEVYQKMRLIWRCEPRVKVLNELFTS